MVWEFKNKVAVIAGGAGGIGSAIAEHFLKNKVKSIILLDNDHSRGSEVTEELNTKYGDKAEFISCDVTTDVDDVTKKIMHKYGYVDVLVNSVGIGDETDAKKTIEINATSVVNWSLKYWDLMRKDVGGKGGTIINISSIYGFRACPFAPIYTATKFAVMGFTKALGHPYNFGRTAVRVVTICPGFTKTELLKNGKLREQGSLDEHLKLMGEEAIFQEPDDVGKAAVEVILCAESGTAWLIEGGVPVVQLT